jgi:hypothetical protein
VGGVYVMGTMQRCTGSVSKPSLQQWMDLGEVGEWWFPLIGVLSERWIEDGIDWWCVCVRSNATVYWGCVGAGAATWSAFG